MENIRLVLQNFNCQNCQQRQQDQSSSTSDDEHIKFKPIGVIKTVFNEKRALPRQAVLGTGILSRIELSPELYTNPEHSLEGLEDFSHFWIVYHFHRNSAHAKAKVAPPRLDGKRIGVFATRSPHRPCPIGLSLVVLDRIEDRVIYFRGTDMVDGTPVLDIKPFIPHYDSPDSAGGGLPTPDYQQILLTKREAPDGEEAENGGATAVRASPTIKVPNWVLKQATLNVTFSTLAESQMCELGVQSTAIKEILKSDPRSTYLRTKYGSDIYTFQLGQHTVTCKFDDDHLGVQVIQIRKKIETENLSNCE